MAVLSSATPSTPSLTEKPLSRWEVVITGLLTKSHGIEKGRGGKRGSLYVVARRSRATTYRPFSFPLLPLSTLAHGQRPFIKSPVIRWYQRKHRSSLCCSCNQTCPPNIHAPRHSIGVRACRSQRLKTEFIPFLTYLACSHIPTASPVTSLITHLIKTGTLSAAFPAQRWRQRCGVAVPEYSGRTTLGRISATARARRCRIRRTLG